MFSLVHKRSQKHIIERNYQIDINSATMMGDNYQISKRQYNNALEYFYTYTNSEKQCLRLSITDALSRSTYEYKFEAQDLQQLCSTVKVDSFRDFVNNKHSFLSNYLKYSPGGILTYRNGKQIAQIYSSMAQNINLDSIQMEALTSFYLIKQICELQEKNFYSFNELTSLRDRLLMKLRTYKFANQFLENLLINSMDYQSEHQYLFYQTGMLHHMSTKQKIVFNPTLVTAQIIKKIIKFSQSGQNIFIFGQEGIGKSLSLAFLCQIVRPIEKYKLAKCQKQERQRNLFRLYHHADLNLKKLSFDFIPKFFYVTLQKSHFQIVSVAQSLQKQTNAELHLSGTFSSQIKQLKDYFRRYSIQIVLIIDQINVYTSLLRQFHKLRQQNQDDRKVYDTIEQMTAFLKGASLVNVVFCSSPCFQAQLLKEPSLNAYDIFDHRQTLRRQKLKYDQNQIGYQRFMMEIIHTILFEIEKRLMKENRQEIILQLIERSKLLLQTKFVKEIFQGSISFEIMSGMTHFLVNKFFQEEFQNTVQALPFLKCKEDQIERQFIRMFDRIRIFSKVCLQKKIANFISKGTSQTKINKLQLLIELRNNTEKQKYQQQQIKQLNNKKSSFCCRLNLKQINNFRKMDFSNDIDSLINQEKRIITVYYNFTLFKEIIKELKLDIQAKSIYVELLGQVNHENQGELGKNIERCYTKLIARDRFKRKLIVKSGQDLYEIYQNQLHFQPFQPKMKDFSISSKLQNILSIFSQLEVNNRYVSAYPVAKLQKESDNSWPIDFLLVKKQLESVKIVTFDFTMSVTKDLVQSKHKKAVTLFQQFRLKNMIQNMYSLQHNIVAPTQVLHKIFHLNPKVSAIQLWRQIKKMEAHDSQLTRNKIKYIPIEEFSIVFLEQYQRQERPFIEYQIIRELIKQRYASYREN